MWSLKPHCRIASFPIAAFRWRCGAQSFGMRQRLAKCNIFAMVHFDHAHCPGGGIDCFLKALGKYCSFTFHLALCVICLRWVVEANS